MSGLIRLLLVAGIVGALIAANMAMLPGEHGNLPARPAPHKPEAAALDWALLEQTEVRPDAAPRYAEALAEYEGERVSLFGYVTLREEGIDLASQEVGSFLLSPGFHFVCCGTSGSTPVTRLTPEATVLIEHQEAPWIKPEQNPGLFIDAIGTLRLTGVEPGTGEPLYRLEDARLAFYTLGEQETWQPHAIKQGPLAGS